MARIKKYLLEEIIDQFIDYRGKTPKKEDIGVPLVTAKIVKGGKILEPNEFISKDSYDNWMTRGFPEINDIVLTTEAPLGEVALIKNKNIALAQRIITLRGNPDIVSNIYLKYFLQSSQGQYELNSRASGTTVFGIKSSVLKKVPVTLPPLPEQKAIAEVLSSLDDKIDLLHRQNKTLEAMAETFFRQWFVEEAEDDWEECVLGDFVDNIRASAKTQSILSDEKYVALEHISKRQIALLDHGLGNEVSSNKYRFQVNDILFGKLRPYFHKVCLAPFSGICSTDILVIRPKQKFLLAFCLFAFFQDEVIGYANLSSGGTRMPRINWEVLSVYPIKVPRKSKIRSFNEIVSPILDKTNQNIRQIKQISAIRDILLPKLMNGHVTIK